MLFVSTAYAQATATAAPAQPSTFEMLIPFVFIFVIFYFLIIRPQSKRQKEHQKFLENIQRGDEVVTASGIFGKVDGLTDRVVTLEISDGVKIKLLRSQVAGSQKASLESSSPKKEEKKA